MVYDDGTWEADNVPLSPTRTAIFDVEVYSGIPINAGCLGVLTFCILFGGVIHYALWNNALQHWRTSQVVLFNNLIPLSTMTWAYFFLHEPFTPTFWAAMVLIVAGVVLGRQIGRKFLECRRVFDLY